MQGRLHAALALGDGAADPLNTGRWDAATSAWVMAGWQVKGYTASTASASQWQMTARSVENTSERILRP